MRKLAVVFAIALALVLTACASSPSAKSGTLSIRGGTSSVPQIMKNNPSFTVRTSGVVPGLSARFSLSGPSAGRATFNFGSAGKLTVRHVKGHARSAVSKANCSYQQIQAGSYTVLGGSSAGKFAGAVGHGTYTVSFRTRFPVVNGACDTSNSAVPVSASLTFRASGPLTVKGN